MVTLQTKKPGIISYIVWLSDWPFMVRGANSQKSTVPAPANMPSIADRRVIPYQNKLISTTGPKAAPNPAQALLTKDKMELSLS